MKQKGIKIPLEYTFKGKREIVKTSFKDENLNYIVLNKN